MKRFLMTILLVTASTTLFGDDISKLSHDERIQAFLKLDWKNPATYELTDSHSTLILPEHHVALIGKDANQAEALLGGLSNNEIEAITYREDLDNSVIFESFQDGYITIDDWGDIDSKALLASISENTEIANKERVKFGSGEIHVVGWLQEPTLDRNTNTVYWAIEASSDEGSVVNSVALRLGRTGYEKLTWVTDKALYVPFGGELETMLQAHKFNPGYTYQDYAKGDKLAGYGIAALVAATVGGKILKVGGFMLLLKKFGGVVLAAIGALFYKFKGLFKRKEKLA